ncbi:unnamed protein product, partial [Brassica oleracea]
MKVHGTRIVIYNLWEDDQGLLELDFDTDPHVCVFTVVYDLQHEKKINMATQFPNSRPFVTYKHSLRMSAVVTIGFVKVAKHHIDVQGFNVYHKNRLIKVSFSFLLCCLCSCQISLTKLYPTYYVSHFGGYGMQEEVRQEVLKHGCASSTRKETE